MIVDNIIKLFVDDEDVFLGIMDNNFDGDDNDNDDNGDDNLDCNRCCDDDIFVDDFDCRLC